MSVTESKLADVSWSDVVNAPVGHVFLDRFDEGVRFLIMRGPAALCAYVGIPEAHPLSGYDYDSLSVQAHGGLTYSNNGGNKSWPEGYWWYGWD